MNDNLPEGVTPELYPFKGRYLALPHGARMHYLDEGSGAPTLLLHGNPTWSFYFRDLVKALRPGRRVIVPDHVGCGLSDKPGDDRYEYSLKSRVADLETLLENLDLKEKITLIVHDWGGMIGMGWAVRHPERVEKIVLLNTGAFFLPEGKSCPFALRLARTPLGSLLVLGFNAFARVSARVCCTRKRLDAALRRAYAAPYNSRANRIATLRFVQDVPLSPGHRTYGLIDGIQSKLSSLSGVPMLICWGMKDFVFDAHFLAEWRRRFPAAEVHTFPDCGHYILEDAGEEVTGLVKNFLGAGR